MNLFSGLLLLITGAQCANILIVYETARRSHQIWIEALAQGLIDKGHNITMGGCFSELFDGGDKYHAIRFEGILLKHSKFNKARHLTSTPLQKLRLNYNYNYAICKSAYRSNGFRTLWNYPTNFTFDLIIMDLTFGPCLYPIIQRFGNPNTVGFTPSAVTPFLSTVFGNGGYPSDVISPLLGPSAETSFLNRVYNYLFTRVEIYYKRLWERRVLQNLAESLLNETFSFKDIEKSISLLFVNDNPLLDGARPLPPNIIPVSGMHLKPAGAMTGVLHSLVNNANQGIIFFTLGTDVQHNIFNRRTKEMFASAFTRLVQKTVIWNKNLRSEDYSFISKTTNILIHKWMPQNDLLGHPYLKLLITTGGTLSIQEALSHEVPVIGIPIYDEHHKNIKYITDNGLGQKLDYNNLTEDNIFEAISNALENPVYKQNLKEHGKKFREQPQNPQEKAVYWVEYILRHKATNGADFLTPKSRNMCFFTAYSMDVELFIFTVLTGIVLTLLIFLRVVLKFCFGLNKTKTGDKQKINKQKLQ